MSIGKKNRNLLVTTFIISCVISSCIPVFDSKIIVCFRNCTNDTLFVGASHYDNIDSVAIQLYPGYTLAKGNIDTTDIFLWNGINVRENIVHPDSTCIVDYDYLFRDNDTCYFFLIKCENAKRFSWDEIRTKKLFRKWIVTKDKEGELDRNIRYLDSAEH